MTTSPPPTTTPHDYPPDINYQPYRVYYVWANAWSTSLGLASTPSASGIEAPSFSAGHVATWPSSLSSNATTTVGGDDTPFASPEPRTPSQIEAEVSVNRDLAEIVDLAPGWLNGDGQAVSRLAIAKAKRVLVGLLSSGVKHPQVVPTPEGGVQAEWSFDDRESSITFEPSGDVYVFSINLDTRQVEERTIAGRDIEQMGELVFRAP